MRKFTKDFLVSTSVSLFIYCAIVTLFFKAEWLQMQTLFQLFAANFILYIAYYFVRKIEFRSVILELLIELLIMEGTILGLGVLLNWYLKLMPWQIALITIAIFIVLKVVEGISTKTSSDYLNQKLKNRQQTTFLGV